MCGWMPYSSYLYYGLKLHLRKIISNLTVDWIALRSDQSDIEK